MSIHTPRGAGPDAFVGEGEMATLMREHPWRDTPLGAPEQWSSTLVDAVRLLLGSRFAMWLGWGPDIRFLYNDAYRPILGDKHPQALGMPTHALWTEIWPQIEPLLRQVYVDGIATWHQALPLLLERHGYAEETYHTFSYSPLFGDTGQVDGVFCAVAEETDRVINERRLKLLRDLATGLAGAGSRAAVLESVQADLARNPHDLVFALVYLVRADEPGDPGEATLAACVGIAPDHRLAPARLDPDAPAWPLGGGLADNQLLRLEAAADLPVGAWQRPPADAVVLPLVGSGNTRPQGALIVGLNPHRPFDEGYLGFVKLVAGQIAASLAHADARDAERRRTAALAEIVELRQAAAEALHRANQRLASEVQQRTEERDGLRALLARAPSAMFLLRGNAHVVELVNESGQALVGPRELLGRPLADALPEVVGQGYVSLLDQVYRSGQAYVGRNLSVELMRTPGGPPEQRSLHVTFQPVVEAADGGVSGIFIDALDVTPQKQVEDELQALNTTLEQRVTQRTAELADALDRLRNEVTEREAAQAALRHAQRMESLGALTGGVAHDFNNLLQVISSNLQLLSRLVAGHEQAELRVRNALAGVGRGAKLASQLLAFGRRQPLVPKVLEIGRLVQGMEDMLRRTLGEQIELETVLAARPWRCQADPAQLENAILNLAINARDAMPLGGRLRLAVSNTVLTEGDVAGDDAAATGPCVCLTVEDTGSGMSPEVLERVFEPFFSTKSAGRGTGLGLSMVYGFLRQSGGHMAIDSEPGRGARVHLYFPQVQLPEDRMVEPDPPAAHGGDETVLVVEDDDAVRESAVAMVRDLGYRVLTARDATGALSLLEAGATIDVLFTDVVMPGPLRTQDLVRQARERQPQLAVLFTSGYAENSIVHGGRLDPGVELLSKPYDREALARRLRQVIGQQAQRPPSGDSLTQAESSAAAPSPDPEPPPVPAPAPEPPPATRSRSGLAVLLVEDDEIVRQAVAMLLADDGHVVHEASNAVSALKALAAQRFDVLMTDIGLPGPSGIDLARQAVARWPGLAVVFATGHSDAASTAHLPDAVVLVKPYFPEEVSPLLLEAVARAAGRTAAGAP